VPIRVSGSFQKDTMGESHWYKLLKMRLVAGGWRSDKALWPSGALMVLRVAIQFLNGLSCLTFVNFTQNENGHWGFDTVQGQLDQILAERWYRRCVVRMFLKVLAGTAEVQHVSKIS